MASRATYGSYQFEENEINLVTLTVQTRYSPRNKVLQRVKTIQCSGELAVNSSLATIIARSAAAEAALSEDRKDFTYTVNDIVAHTLTNTADCASGVRVVQRSFPKGDATQLVNTRSFSFTLQATYDAAEEDLVFWQDSIEVVGTGGPRLYLVETTYQPYAQFVTNASVQQIFRRGSAAGYSSYPLPPGPVSGPLENEPARRIRRESARSLGGGLRIYPISWSYHQYHDPSTFGPFTALPVSQ